MSDDQTSLTPDEQAVMDKILAAGDAIYALGLNVNQTELALYIHGLQSFVVQHMLGRIEGGKWSRWYDDPEPDR